MLTDPSNFSLRPLYEAIHVFPMFSLVPGHVFCATVDAATVRVLPLDSPMVSPALTLAVSQRSPAFSTSGFYVQEFVEVF